MSWIKMLVNVSLKIGLVVLFERGLGGHNWGVGG